MKVIYPLSFKVSLWLLLNLLLLGAAGATFYWTQFGRGWDSLLVGALGERLQATADGIMSEGLSSGESGLEAALVQRGRRTNAEFFLFHNEGHQVAGRPVKIPDAVRAELSRGPRRGPPGEGGPPLPPGYEGRPEDAPRGGKKGFGGPPSGGRGPGGGRPPGAGRFIVRTAEPTETWIGLRVPLLREFAQPGPGTLIIRAPHLLALLRLFDVLPWLGLIAGAFGLSLLLWVPLIGGITRALRDLNRATEAIAEGQFDTRVPDTRRDELGHLGQSVNRMAGRLEMFVNGQKRFLGDVAHELGSPIGRLQVATEILEARADPALREHVSDVREEVQQMAVLVNELLAFTKASMRTREAHLVPVEIDTLVAEVLSREDPRSRVNVEPVHGVRAQADRLLLVRALGNLVRNALRYAGDLAVIALRVRTEGGNVFVVVEDDGPGVPDAALERLGEPFFRPETARTRETGGVGLGLAIVRTSVAACGGEVQVTNRTPQGFRAEVRLALAT